MKKSKGVSDIGSFESKLNNLKDIVEKMNSGSITLDESLECFEEGVQLYRSCKEQLDKVEARVKLIVQEEESKEINFDEMLGE